MPQAVVPQRRKRRPRAAVLVSKAKDGKMDVRKEAATDAPDELAKIARSTLEELEGGRG